MKPTAQELKTIQRMQPGVITLSGFLGSDTRHLNEIIADDAAVLNRLDRSPRNRRQDGELHAGQLEQLSGRNPV